MSKIELNRSASIDNLRSLDGKQVNLSSYMTDEFTGEFKWDESAIGKPAPGIDDESNVVIAFWILDDPNYGKAQFVYTEEEFNRLDQKLSTYEHPDVLFVLG